MDGKLINNTYLQGWVNEFLLPERIEADKHIDDILGLMLLKAKWIETAIQIYHAILAFDSGVRAFVLIRQKTGNATIETVNTAQLIGIMMPPTIILYKCNQESVLFEDCLYSPPISKQFNLPAYVHYDSDGECDVYIGGDKSISSVKLKED